MNEIVRDSITRKNQSEAATAGGFSSGRFSVAPMLDWTDRHCRYFHRLLSRHAQLYTEM
ncbi:MAG: tRNA dihydrouridine(20/20a) synthase DusA, partial [Gammaproteobacteria bacterium]|nr:tRNA dihydrouridine(20/20a) synthase DusA [Gammaproteobacteria bacterium]